MNTRWNWTQIQLAIGKYIGAIFGGFFLVMAVAARDLSFLALGGFFSLVSLTQAVIQNGLLAGRRWARISAFTLAILQLPTLLLPIAALSLRDLQSRGSPELTTTETSFWRSHRPLAVVFGSVIALFIAVSLIFGNGLGFREKPLARHSTQGLLK